MNIILFLHPFAYLPLLGIEDLNMGKCCLLLDGQTGLGMKVTGGVRRKLIE